MWHIIWLNWVNWYAIRIWSAVYHNTSLTASHSSLSLEPSPFLAFLTTRWLEHNIFLYQISSTFMISEKIPRESNGSFDAPKWSMLQNWAPKLPPSHRDLGLCRSLWLENPQNFAGKPRKNVGDTLDICLVQIIQTKINLNQEDLEPKSSVWFIR